MSERKVLNKYFPPNFDPSQIPRQKKPKDLQHKVRLMAPFSMRCESCGEYIYKGKKFNARKETVEGEAYLGIKIFRFYIRCPRCSAEITFKTDPKNTDYLAENGASRNFEPWRGEGEEDKGGEEEEEEREDPMQALENRTLDSKREMEIMDALDEIRTRNARSERVDVDDVLDKFSEEDREQIQLRLTAEEQEDEEVTLSFFKSGDGEHVRKLSDTIEPDAITLVNQSETAKVLPSFKVSSFSQQAKRKKEAEKHSIGLVVKKKKTEEKPALNALSMLASYDGFSDDSNED
ncbi:CWC16 protein [Phycomyces nitens]|nr:CWC16 protein [Phycomyces nitens]